MVNATLPSAVAETSSQIGGVCTFCDCPHCKSTIDIADREHYELLGEYDFYLAFGCEGFNQQITCRYCNKDFIVSEIVY